MKLPNCENAVIEPSKLTNYLLNPDHRRGKTKAQVLNRFGYNLDNWQELDRDLRRFHLAADVDLVKETDYGIRYEITTFLDTPTRRSLRVRTVWQIDKGTDFPRLITLFPD